MQHASKFFIVFISLTIISCGGSTGTGSSTTSTTASVKSLDEVPTVDNMVNQTSASSSVSKAVSGTPPLLKGLSSSNADTYFWNGLLATITAAGTATSAQIDAYWDGEGACRMAQTVGYAFQNMLQGGTSLCYMQGMPKSANGVTVTNGTATASDIFDQGTSSQTMKVQVANDTQQGGPENIFIKVYGSGTTEGAAGYAVDLWFCSTAGVASGYEQIRVSDTALTVTSVHQDFGKFVSTISGTLTTNTAGNKIFDPSKTRSANVYFAANDSSFTFLGLVSIDANNRLIARDYFTGTFGGGQQTNKHAVFANYSGDTMDTLRFSAAAFALIDIFGGSEQVVTGATEYQSAFYTPVTSGTLLTTAQAEDFTNAIYTGSTTTYTTLLAATSNFSCSTTPDVTVALDFSASGPQAVAAACENDFSSMNFCDGTAVNAVRTIVFTSQASMGPTCETSFCTDDFSCQKWADNNIGNAEGVTTANADCSNNGCCQNVED